MRRNTAPRNGMVYDPELPGLPFVPLIGREFSLAQIKRRLFKSDVVLTGLPGVGKTALVRTLARDPDVQARFSDGIFWAGLGPSPNVQGVLARWGSLVEFTSSEMDHFTSELDWSKALHATIGSRKVLLIIDDVWDHDHIKHLTIGGPQCAHLFTTRLPSLAHKIAADTMIVIRELGEHESFSLLYSLAPNSVEAEEEKAYELIQAVGGLPLAIVLMGYFLRSHDYSKQSRRIATALAHLADTKKRLELSELFSPVNFDSQAIISLQSMIALSYEYLDQREQDTLRALSLFPAKPNSFSQEAALAVAVCTPDRLEKLADSGLLERVESERFTCHQTIADYARHQGPLVTAQARFVTYMMEYIETHASDIPSLREELQGILAALEMAHQLAMHSVFVHGVISFAPFFFVDALYGAAHHLLSLARQDAAALNDDQSLATVLWHLGKIAQKRDESDQAEAYFQEGLAIAHGTQDTNRICAFLAHLGSLSWKRGNYSEAEQYLHEGLTLARLHGYAERMSEMLLILGSAAANRGNYQQSLSYLEEGLMLARQIGNLEHICALLISLGVAESNQGHYFESKKYAQEGLEIARRIGHREWTGLLLNNLGDVASEEQDYVQAEISFQEALTIAQEIERHEWIALALLNLGIIARKQGQYDQANTSLQESLRHAERLLYVKGYALYEMGNLSLDQHHEQAANVWYQKMLDMLGGQGQELIALAQYGLARVAAAESNFQAANELGELSLRKLEEVGHRSANEVRLWLQTRG